MIVAWEHNGRWLLVRNVRASDIRSRRDTSPRVPGVTTFDDCWTGEAWVSDPALGLSFGSRQEALNYLRQNDSRMEQST